MEEIVRLLNESEEDLKNTLIEKIKVYKDKNMVCIPLKDAIKWKKIDIPMTEEEMALWDKALEMASDIIRLTIYERQQERLEKIKE